MKKIKTSGEHRKTVSTNQHVVRKTTDDVPALQYNTVIGSHYADRWQVIATPIQKVK